MTQDHKQHSTSEQKALRIHQNYGQVNQIELNIILEVVVNQHTRPNINLQ